MKLYEIMQQHPAARARIVTEFAQHFRSDKAARRQLTEELGAILERRREMLELPNRPELSPELAAAARASYTFDIAALDALFLEICRALDAEGVTMTGGEISALKRLGLPDALAAELDALKGGKIAELPAAERLDADTAKSLYSALTSTGLISGPWDTFAYYLGQQQTNAKPKRPETPLSWRGTAAELAYFIDRFPRKRKKPYTRALCLAFGIDERKRVNVVQSAHTHADEAKGTTQIDMIFNNIKK